MILFDGLPRHRRSSGLWRCAPLCLAHKEGRGGWGRQHSLPGEPEPLVNIVGGLLGGDRPECSGDLVDLVGAGRWSSDHHFHSPKLRGKTLLVFADGAEECPASC